MSSDQLFDPSEFASPADSGRSARRKTGTRKYRTGLDDAEPSDGSWSVITTVGGPIPACHRVAGAYGTDGSVITKCEVIGRILKTPEAGAMVIPCDTCKENDNGS